MPLQAVPEPRACAPYGSSEYFEYGYLPALAPAIVFTIIFFLIGCVQAVYMVRYRAWWMFFLVAGAGLDCLGWIGRLVSHYCPYSSVMNTMQIATLIMGPAWTQAGVYCAMWVFIRTVGEQISPVSPTWYLWVCVSVDTVCLALQAAGGGVAGTAVENNESPATGTTLMVVGIIAQLVCGVAFLVFVSWVFTRGRKTILADRAFTLLAFAITLSTAMMVLRGFYRSVELLQGWTGYLITHEAYLFGLDAVPMVIAMGVLAILSPGPLLAKRQREQAQRESVVDSREEKALDTQNSDGSETTLPGTTEQFALDGKGVEQHNA